MTRSEWTGHFTAWADVLRVLRTDWNVAADLHSGLFLARSSSTVVAAAGRPDALRDRHRKDLQRAAFQPGSHGDTWIWTAHPSTRPTRREPPSRSNTRPVPLRQNLHEMIASQCLGVLREIFHSDVSDLSVLRLTHETAMFSSGA
jgi:hypothetical protein